MPLYEYQCRSCGSHTEVMQRFSDPPLSTCEECGGDLKKLISAPAFQFKGEGWYVTDYAKKEKGKENKDGAKAKEDGGKEAKDDGGGTKAKDTGGATKAERSASATPPKSTSSTTG